MPEWRHRKLFQQHQRGGHRRSLKWAMATIFDIIAVTYSETRQN
jgi:hypothetical protein